MRNQELFERRYKRIRAVYGEGPELVRLESLRQFDVEDTVDQPVDYVKLNKEYNELLVINEELHQEIVRLNRYVTNLLKF